MFDTLINEGPQAATEEAGHPRREFADYYGDYMRAVEQRMLELRDDPDMSLDQANLRFSTAMDVSRLKGKRIVLVGVGGIGAWVLRVLVGMGAENITIVDDDSVEIHNVGPQAYSLLDIGRQKVSVTHDEVLRFRGVRLRALATRVTSYRQIYELLGEAPDILITAVDNMEFRNAIGHHLAGLALSARRGTVEVDTNHLIPGVLPQMQLPETLIDLRMGLGQWNAFCLPLRRMHRCMRAPEQVEEASALQLAEKCASTIQYYKEYALFDESEGVEEACTERAIVYTGANIASYVGALVHFLVDNRLRDPSDLLGFLDVTQRTPDFKWMRAYNSRNWVDGKPAKGTQRRFRTR